MGDGMAAVECSRESTGGVTVVVRGEIDMSNARSVGERIDAAVTDPPGRVLLDLGSVGYVDTSGVRMLGHLGRRLGPLLTVVAPSGSVARDVLEITGFVDHLRVVDSAELGDPRD